jgi:uncharacterized protein (TIGR03083 family)
METDGVRRRFEQATAFFVATVARVGPAQWEQPGLGEWSIRDLVGHTSRAMRAVEGYLAQGAELVEIHSPVEYFLGVRESSGAAQVAQRGREAGAALGSDPPGAVREMAARVLGVVARADAGQLVGAPRGGMTLGAYLPTRTFELVVHTLDLAAALDVPAEPPAAALAEALEIAAGLALHAGQGGEVLLALTGRRPLPAGFSLI